MSGTARRVMFVCNGSWMGGPVIFLKRSTGALPALGWRPKLLLTGTVSSAFDLKNWPCPYELIGPTYSWSSLSKRVANAISGYRPEVVVGMAGFATKLGIHHLYRHGETSVRMLDTVHLDVQCEYDRVRSNLGILTAVAAVSGASVQELRRQIPELADRAFRMWSPVPCVAITRQHSTEGPLKLLYVARLSKVDKRINDLPPLVTALIAKGVDFTLTVVGDGPDRTDLEREFASIRDAHRTVKILGQLENEKVLELLHEHDVFLLVSDAEGQPIALLEAMAAGLVPVVTDLPGMREVVADNVNGFLVPVGDIRQFASAISILATNRHLLCDMGSVASQEVRETHSMQTATSRLADLLETVAELPIPDIRAVPEQMYPAGRLARWRVPDAVQAVVRQCLGRQLN